MSTRHITEERKRERLALLWPEDTRFYIGTKLLIVFCTLVVWAQSIEFVVLFRRSVSGQSPDAVLLSEQITGVAIWTAVIRSLWRKLQGKYPRVNARLAPALTLLLLAATAVATGTFLFAVADVSLRWLVDSGDVAYPWGKAIGGFAKALIACVVIRNLWRELRQRRTQA